MIITVIMVSLCVLCGCSPQVAYDPRPNVMKKGVLLEFRLFYEQEDEKAGQPIAPGTMIRYSYNGKTHCPEVRTFFQDKEIFTLYKPRVSVKIDESVWGGSMVEKGTYQIKICLDFSDVYVSDHNNFNFSNIKDNYYYVIIE